MNFILVQIISDTTATVTKNDASGVSHSIWFWMSLIELIIIIMLLLRIIRNKLRSKFKDVSVDLIEKAKHEDIDMTDVMDSINKSRELYKSLSSKYHPDRFELDAHKIIANEIFQEIVESKRNYKKLLDLKAKAESKLNV